MRTPGTLRQDSQKEYVWISACFMWGCHWCRPTGFVGGLLKSWRPQEGYDKETNNQQPATGKKSSRNANPVATTSAPTTISHQHQRPTVRASSGARSKRIYSSMYRRWTLGWFLRTSHESMDRSVHQSVHHHPSPSINIKAFRLWNGSVESIWSRCPGDGFRSQILTLAPQLDLFISTISQTNWADGLISLISLILF